MTKNIIIYCDGACLGNPGPGGYAALLIHKGKTVSEKVVAGSEKFTTNNKMELMAAISGLEALKKPCSVEIYCDSQYVIKGITEWLENWQARGFKTSNGKAVANEELWRRLSAAVQVHRVSWHWVRGHAGNELNERVDEIAKEQAALAAHGSHR